MRAEELSLQKKNIFLPTFALDQHAVGVYQGEPGRARELTHYMVLISEPACTEDFTRGKRGDETVITRILERFSCSSRVISLMHGPG